MRFLDLYISGFGKFHDYSLSFQPGLNLICGKNEAGKSTIHTFIRAMLFGLERGRGRVSKSDPYTKYEPWEQSAVYGGRLRLEKDGMIYRIERSFARGNKSVSVVNETLGRQEPADKLFWDQLLCGLSETTYNNTISISQLKSATDSSMVSELKNYIANLNTSGNMALNITKATDFLKQEKKMLEAQMLPEAARTYTSLLGEIRNIEKEISAPEFENHLAAVQEKRSQIGQEIAKKQLEKEELLQKIARGRQVLSGHQFTDQDSVTQYLMETQKLYQEYQDSKTACEKKSGKVCSILAVAAGVILAAAGAGLLLLSSAGTAMTESGTLWSLMGTGALTWINAANAGTLSAAGVGAAVLGILLSIAGIALIRKRRRLLKELALTEKALQEIFSKHLGDNTISKEALSAFQERMAEFTRLSAALVKSESSVTAQTQELTALQAQQENCGTELEKQQKLQWELERKLEHLAHCKDQAESLKQVLAENDRIRDEIAAIDLAQETMTELSTSIRASFGVHLNQTASDLVSGITGGIYSSMSVDENLNIFMNTKTKLVPVEQVSSGTMDQIYLALRLATARLMQGGTDQLPLIFDDSFVQYDDSRVKTALTWLAQAYHNQILVFTCHEREARLLKESAVPCHVIRI